MKSILVIDTPKDCPECPCFRAENDVPTYYGEYCSVIRKGLSGEKPEWCPLKLLPQKKGIDKTLEFGGYENIIQESLARGYNACLEEITE